MSDANIIEKLINAAFAEWYAFVANNNPELPANAVKAERLLYNYERLKAAYDRPLLPAKQGKSKITELQEFIKTHPELDNITISGIMVNPLTKASDDEIAENILHLLKLMVDYKNRQNKQPVFSSRQNEK